MILQAEINTIAEKIGVPKSTIDKDWALGHFLNGLYQDSFCRENWIFKGGTCLKKCYFQDYRFSEDLDFTLLDENYVLEQAFIDKVCQNVEQISGIKLSINELREMKFDGKKTGYKAVIKFWGADHPKNVAPPSPERWQTKIKIELIQFEKMIFDTPKRSLFHNYSDKNLIQAIIPCYSISEVLAEKLRALIQRNYTPPRNYYDIWYLSRNYPDLDWKKITEAFHLKMAYKGLTFTGIEQMLRIEDLKRFKID
jgi:predicted nucleotidyltransferase component of viral defense system